jgi:hypothetical protein
MRGILVDVERSTRRSLHRLAGSVLGLALLAASLIGCSSSSDVKVVPFSKAEQDLSKIAMAYSDAQSDLGRPPKNAEEIKPFLKGFGNPEAMLTSPNDGQLYVVVWGANTTQGGPTEYKGMFPILAYERKGAGGRRAVTDIRGRPMSIPDEDFPKLTFVRGHKPSPD